MEQMRAVKNGAVISPMAINLQPPGPSSWNAADPWLRPAPRDFQPKLEGVAWGSGFHEDFENNFPTICHHKLIEEATRIGGHRTKKRWPYERSFWNTLRTATARNIIIVRHDDFDPAQYKTARRKKATGSPGRYELFGH